MRQTFHPQKLGVPRKLILVVLCWLLAACSTGTPQPTGTPVDSPQPDLQIETPATLPEPTTSAPVEFMPPFGVTVSAKSLCSDGVKTVLTMQTDLNPIQWKLAREDFFPQGKTYFETSILLLENGLPYGTTMSGFRNEPEYDFLTGKVRTKYVYEIPEVPQPGSVFSLKANVSLIELPPGYMPPAPLEPAQGGYLPIPMDYEVPIQLAPCP